MFAKIFSQIYDSSIVETPDTRFTFMDLLVLADRNGVVDMTHEAISRRTNRPIDVIRKTISELEAPDNRSRSPEFDGARIKRLDDHRDWGWMIVNYEFFREIASEEQRREKTLARVNKFRGRKKLHKRNTLKRTVTLGNDLPSPSASPSISSFPEGFESEWENFKTHRRAIRHPMTPRAEQLIIKSLLERPNLAVEALQVAIKNNWRGFEWEWFDNRKASRNGAGGYMDAKERKQAEIDEANRKYREKKAKREEENSRLARQFQKEELERQKQWEAEDEQRRQAGGH